MTFWWRTGWPVSTMCKQRGLRHKRLSSCTGRRTVMEFNSYIGLDVHKETIAVAIADAGRDGEVRFYGEIANTPDAVASLLKKLGGRRGKLHYVYEAGPCGYGLYRQIIDAATLAKSSRPPTHRGAPAIMSRPIDATRLCWRACPAPESSHRSGFRTKRMRRCAISFAPARPRRRTCARLGSASRAFFSVMVAAMPARYGKEASSLARRSELRSSGAADRLSDLSQRHGSGDRPQGSHRSAKSKRSCPNGPSVPSSRLYKRCAASPWWSPPAWWRKSATCGASTIPVSSWPSSVSFPASIRAEASGN